MKCIFFFADNLSSQIYELNDADKRMLDLGVDENIFKLRIINILFISCDCIALSFTEFRKTLLSLKNICENKHFVTSFMMCALCTLVN